MKKIKCPKRKNVFWVICILIIMVGCSKNEDNENKKIDQSPYAVLNAKEAPDYNFYDENELEMYMHNDFDGFVDDGNQLITLLQTFEKDDVELTNPIYTYQSIKDGETKDINLKELTKDGQFNKCILYNRALNQYMATSYNSNNIDLYNSDWNHIKTIKINELDNKEIIELNGDAKYMYIDAESITGEYGYFNYVVDYDGNIVFQFDGDENLNYSTIYNEYNGNFLHDWQNNKIFKFDESKGLVEVTEYNSELLSEIDFLFAGNEKYDFFGEYTNEDNTYLVGINSDSVEVILNLKDYGYINWHISEPKVRQNGNILIVLYNLKSNQKKLMEFTPSKERKTSLDDSQKTELVILVDCENSTYNDLAYSFNLQSSEYKVVLKSYDDEIDGDIIKQKTYMDVLAGGRVDGLIQTNMNYNEDEYINSGMIQDLNDYFEKSELVKKEMFMDGVVDSITASDGKIYRLYTDYYLSGFIGKDNKYMSEYAMKTGDIGVILLNSGDEYIDYDKGSIKLEELQHVIEELKTNANNNSKVEVVGGTYENLLYLIKKDNVFAQVDSYGIQYLLGYSIKMNGNMTYSNAYIDSPIIYPGNINISVVSNSEKKEGMYEFLDFAFCEENYYKLFCDYDQFVGTSGFPVLKSTWDDVMNFYSTEGKYKNKYGMIVESKGVCMDLIEGVNGLLDESNNVMPTEAELENLDGIVKSAKYVKELNYDIYDVICEEANEYFESNQTIDETMSNIEEKVNDILRDIDN